MVYAKTQKLKMASLSKAESRLMDLRFKVHVVGEKM